VRNRGKGKKEAMLTGIMAARSRLIVTTDADCTMGNNWIKTIAVFFEKNNPDLIICPVQMDGQRGFFGKFQELEFLSLQGVTAGSVMACDGLMCNGANLAFTRDTYLNHIDQLHFNLATGDDVFMLHSLKKEVNSRIMWLESTDSIVSTISSSTVRSFLSQRKRWLSKWNTYNDPSTILAGIFTFGATLLQLAALVSVFFSMEFIWTFLTILILKSAPDFLILRNTTKRYGKIHLMRWFLPAQLLYPVYVIGVVLFSLIPVEARAD